MNAEEVKAFDWDDEILDDGKEMSFVTLEEGDYDFTVSKMERSYYTPSASSSLPPCNMAVVTLHIHTDGGETFIEDKLMLCSKMEWKLSSFFRSIGLKKHGEKLTMKWSAVPGATGKVHVTKTEGTKEGRFFNNVGYYIDPVAKADDTKKEEETWS